MGKREVFEIADGVLKKYHGRGGDVTIPLFVTEIGESAFEGCETLYSVYILHGVKKIGARAFFNCWRLNSVTIPDTVTDIGKDAFSGCQSLADRNGFVLVGGILYEYTGLGGDLELPEGVWWIEDRAFYGCEGLKSLRLPDSLRIIGNGAFESCRGLTEVRIPSGDVRIGFQAFMYCSCLKSVTVSGKSEAGKGSEVGDLAFLGCSSLSSLTLPEDTTRIGEEAFYFCESLTGVTLPDALERIGKHAFLGCWSLGYTKIPEGVKEIADELLGPLYAECRTPYAAAHVSYPVYLAGSPFELEPDKQADAAMGYFYATVHGIPEIDRWKEDYEAIIREHAAFFLQEAEEDRDILLFLIGLEIPDRDETRHLLERYADSDHPEVTAALLQYQKEKFGDGGWGDMSL